MENQPVPNTTASKRAPYGNFVIALIVMTLALCGGIFTIVAATTTGTADAFDKLMKGTGWFVATIGTSYWAKRTWAEIVRIEPAPMFDRKHRSFVLRAGVAICAVLVVAAVLGTYMGIRWGHVTQINTMTEQFRTLGWKGMTAKQRYIQAARQETRTMPEYIERCRVLELALNDYEPNLQEADHLLSQILEELQYLKADPKYAKLIPTSSVLQKVFRKDIESARVFGKEVEYAKRLAALDSPDDRTRFYTANIMPVKDDEERIANDEREILKDAQARGISLGRMYREAGVQ